MPQSHRKVWWRSGTCKTGQPQRWQAAVKHRTTGTKCPYNTGRAVCPCNNVAHNHPEVAAEWDWDANGERTPETVTAVAVPATPKQPGGVPSVGTNGVLLWLAERHKGLDALSVPTRPAARRHGIPASAVEHCNCWLSGTGKPISGMAGTQIRSFWAQPSRCTESCKRSASWAWYTDGRHHHTAAQQ